MIWQRVRVALLASMVTMSMALPIARSGKAHAGSCGSDCAPATPCYQTVKVWECVPEHYTTTRTCYKQVQVQEKYTAWKCEKVPEQRVRKVCYYEKVPCEEIRTRTCCVKVPYCAERTCYEKYWTCKQVTCYKKKCCDQGHWECRQVEKKPLFEKKCCGDSCCPKCPKYKTVKCWVPCKVWIEEPYCKTVRCCEYKPVCKKVTCYRTETRCENYKVCTWKCVPREKTECYTVCVEKKTPYEACRTVCKNVPYEEKVQCCRMVKRCVEKQVPVCEPSCKPCKSKKCCGW
jgi:hypothetical protein